MFHDSPLVTVVIPSYQQGQFLEQALISIFSQNVEVEVYVMDGGSTDNSIDIIRKWEHRLSAWRSNSDEGQAAAINEGVSKGTAPYVCWLNSDDWFMPNGLKKLLDYMERSLDAPAVYGRAWNIDNKSGRRTPVWVERFNEDRLALRCFISQPATMIRRSAWEAVGGLDQKLNLAMDYDLWWKLFKLAGPLNFVDDFVAVNRIHADTKTNTQRARHYKEAMKVILKHYGHIPVKWWLLQPYAVWFKSIINRQK